MPISNNVTDLSTVPLLAGRAGGQILTGGTASGDDLTLRSTSNGTKGNVIIDETTVSTSSTTGALIVGGGVGIADDLFVGDAVTLGGDLSFVNTKAIRSTDGGVAFWTFYGSGFGNQMQAGAILAQNNATESTSNVSGSLNTAGGVGVTKRITAKGGVFGEQGSGTDVAGTILNLSGGESTGTGAPGPISLKTAFAAASTGSSVNTSIDRFYVNPIPKALTDATAVSLFEVALPASTMCGGKISYSVYCTDGTDFQANTGTIIYSAVNKAGAYTTDIKAFRTDLVIGVETSASSSGTLADTWTIVAGTNKVTLKVSADTSLTPTSFEVIYTVENNSKQVITIL